MLFCNFLRGDPYRTTVTSELVLTEVAGPRGLALIDFWAVGGCRLRSLIRDDQP
jgi:hypothetical protein